MPEALWVQQSGISYDASEDRRLISALSTEGTVLGLGFSLSSALNISVSPGIAIIPDVVGSPASAGGAYVGYTTTSTTVAVPAGASGGTTYNVFMQVNTTTGLVSITSGSTPTNPYVVIGTATANTTAVTAVNTSSRVQALPPAIANSPYVPAAGGTYTGGVVGTTLSLSGILSAAGGVKMGAASNPVMRHYWAGQTADSATVVPAGAWTRISMSGTVGVLAAISDYGVTPMVRSGCFQAPVSGFYAFSGYVTLPAAQTDELNTERAALIARFPNTSPSGTFATSHQGYAYTAPQVPVVSHIGQGLPLSATIYLSSAQYACACVYQNGPRSIAVNSYGMNFTLVSAV